MNTIFATTLQYSNVFYTMPSLLANAKSMLQIVLWNKNVKHWRECEAETTLSINCENLEIDPPLVYSTHTHWHHSSACWCFPMQEAGAKCRKKKMYLCLSILPGYCEMCGVRILVNYSQHRSEMNVKLHVQHSSDHCKNYV